jgi:hypothetical protein
MKTSLAGLLSAAILTVGSAASAAPIILPTELGPQAFDTDNFATSVVDSSCSASCLTFGSGVGIEVGPLTTAQIEPFLVGADLSRGVGLGAGDLGGVADFVIPAFGSLASIANGPGYDFVVWEAGSPTEPILVSVSLGGGVFSGAIAYQTFVVSPFNSDSGFQTNSIHIDLDDFGIAPGALIDQVRIQGLFTGIGGSGPDVLAVAALNAGPPTIPEPGALALLGLGLAGLAARRRTRS